MIRPRLCMACLIRPRTRPTYDASRRHGYTCRCPVCGWWGPWAPTDQGAMRQWNRMVRDALAAESEAAP